MNVLRASGMEKITTYARPETATSATRHHSYGPRHHGQHPHRGDQQRDQRRRRRLRLLRHGGLRGPGRPADSDANVATPTTSPDGSADVITRRTKPGCARSLFGASDRMNAGMPMVNHAAIVTWIGWNGNSSGSVPKIFDAKPGQPDEHRQQHRVHRLGEEQVGDPFDVADHPPALADDVRQRGELVVQQHDLGDRARRRAARAHRHADVGVLERQHVVDAVAGHRHGVPARLQRVHHRPLLVGPHPAERGVLVQRVGQLRRVRRAAPGRPSSRPPGRASRRPRRPTPRCRRR